MKKPIEIEVIEDIEIKGKPKHVNVPWEMCKSMFPYVLWFAIAFLGFLAMSQILDAIIV